MCDKCNEKKQGTLGEFMDLVLKAIQKDADKPTMEQLLKNAFCRELGITDDDIESYTAMGVKFCKDMFNFAKDGDTEKSDDERVIIDLPLTGEIFNEEDGLIMYIHVPSTVVDLEDAKFETVSFSHDDNILRFEYIVDATRYAEKVDLISGTNKGVVDITNAILRYRLATAINSKVYDTNSITILNSRSDLDNHIELDTLRAIAVHIPKIGSKPKNSTVDLLK